MKLFKNLFSRTIIISSLILTQLLILIWAIVALSENFVYAYVFFMIISVIMVIWIVNKNMDPTLKLPWVIVIMLVPVFGGLFYALFGINSISKEEHSKMKQAMEDGDKYLNCTEKLQNEIDDIIIRQQFDYIQNTTNMPVYKNTTTTFLSPGEEKFKHLLIELERAEKFIFLEYFIIEQGIMWDSILDILKTKASKGVDVRVMYDDAGTINLLPTNYDETLREMGIKCQVFNILKPSLKVGMHNRDHRKILVIDGKVGYVGGINFADEYINAINKHGHWKDSSMAIYGDAVWGLSVMFLKMWNYNLNTDEDYLKFKIDSPQLSNGYIQPYGETPFDKEITGEAIYLNIINTAKQYVYIETPYFIVDNQILVALETAAKRGIDVRIVTPKNGDRWLVHNVTRSHYLRLVEAGVSVYEYTPGFIHAKICISDDVLATIGTVNMDYRSLYHHYECGCLMYKTSAVLEIKKDFDEIMKVSEKITMQECKNVPFFTKYITSVIKIFAPLL